MERLTTFITQSGYSRIPGKAMENAKKCILDGLGVAIAGLGEPVCRLITEYVKEIGASPEAGVIGAGFKANCSHAALANGTFMHALDFDDGTSSSLHPTCVILPVVLALGEREKASGRKVLEAYVLGWEVGVRVAEQISVKTSERGWHNTSAIGTVSAAVAATKMLGLNSQQTRNALGIASSMAGGLRANIGTDTKPLQAGNTAANGVLAGLLARKGLTANPSILQTAGLPKSLSGSDLDFELLLSRLGNPFDIISPGPTFKLYPSCGTGHPCVSIILDLIRANRIQAEDVSEVECRVAPGVTNAMRFHNPMNPVEAKFSLEYCMAVALLDREVSLRQFTEDKVNSPEVRALMKKVKVLDNINSVKTRGSLRVVTVTLRNGTRYSGEATSTKGTPESPLNWDEVSQKFYDCVNGVFKEDVAKRIAGLVADLEVLEDISILTDLVTAGEK